MRNLQIRNVPEHTCAELRRRAAVAGMSLQEYLLATVNDLARRPTVSDVLGRAGGRDGGRVRLASAAKHLRAERDRR